MHLTLFYAMSQLKRHGSINNDVPLTLFLLWIISFMGLLCQNVLKGLFSCGCFDIIMGRIGGNI